MKFLIYRMVLCLSAFVLTVSLTAAESVKFPDTAKSTDAAKTADAAKTTEAVKTTDAVKSPEATKPTDAAKTTAAAKTTEPKKENAVKPTDQVARKAGRHGIKVTAKNRKTGGDVVTYSEDVEAVLPERKKDAAGNGKPQQMRLKCEHMVVSLLPIQDGAPNSKRQAKEIVCTKNVHLFDGTGKDVTADKITFYFVLPAATGSSADLTTAKKEKENDDEVKIIVGEGRVKMVEGNKRELTGEKLTIYMRPGGGQEIEKLIGEKNVHLNDPQSGKEMNCDKLTLYFREGEKQEIDRADGVGHVKLADKKDKSTISCDQLSLFFTPAENLPGQEKVKVEVNDKAKDEVKDKDKDKAKDKAKDKDKDKAKDKVEVKDKDKDKDEDKDPFQFGNNKLMRAEGIGHCIFEMPGFSLTTSQDKGKGQQRPDTKIISDRSIINREDNTFEFDGHVVAHEKQLKGNEEEESLLYSRKMILYAEPTSAKKDSDSKTAPSTDSMTEEEEAALLVDNAAVTDNGAKKSQSVPDEILIGRNLRLIRVVCSEYVRLIRETRENAAARSEKKPKMTLKSREHVCGSHAEYTVNKREIVITGTETDRPWLILENAGKPTFYEEGDRVLVNLEARSKKADGNIRDEILAPEAMKKKLDQFQQILNEKGEK